jgi:superfamily II DNA or RNA helicase
MYYSKLDRRIDDMLKYESDDFLVNINLSKDISNKLLNYQYLHVFNLITALRTNNAIIDGSDTGTGKTYTAIAVCKHLNLNPVIICPKSIISSWKHVCDYFEVNPVMIVNYETLKNGKQYDEDGDRIKCKYVTIDENYKTDRRFVWKFYPNSKNTVVIFDEVHRCKNKNSLNGKLLMSLKRFQCKLMMLSATIADTPEFFHVFGYMLNLYKNMRQGRNWINGMLREDKNYIGVKPKLSAIHRELFNFKGSMMSIKELGNKFPKNQVCANCYNIDKKYIEEVNDTFNVIKSCMIKNRIKNDNSNKLTNIIKARQKLELLKLYIIEDLIQEYLDNGYSVVVFINFTKSLEQLAHKFKTNCTIKGGQDVETRTTNIYNFQENKQNLIICNIKAGSEGINLHDKYGKPRVSIISPSFSSIELTQALGRIYRAGSKTPALQRIIFCANTCEENICNKIKNKLKFTSKINDDDLINFEDSKNYNPKDDLIVDQFREKYNL